MRFVSGDGLVRYFNWASTTPVFEPNPADIRGWLEDFENPADRTNDFDAVINSSKSTILNSIRAPDDARFVFTSGGSEANSFVLLGWFLKRIREAKETVLITTPIEHHSILNCAEFLKENGVTVEYLKVDSTGRVNLDYYDFLLKSHKGQDRNVLVSVAWVNNEIGTIQDVPLLARMAHENDALFHTDAVQAYCHIFISMELSTDIDFMSVSGHKIGAVKGIGGVYFRNKELFDEVSPIIFGGKQEYGMRGGTSNLIGMRSFSLAVRKMELMGDVSEENRRIKRNIILELKKYGLDFIVNGPQDPYLSAPNILSLSFKGVYGESLMYCLNSLFGITVSTGSACSSDEEVSHVLKEVHCPEEYINGTIRISFGNYISSEDVKFLTKSIYESIQKIQSI